MSEMHLVESDNLPLAEPLSFEQRDVLHRAVAKIILLGEQVGVNADHMILLLESGLTVGELLDYLYARNRESA